MMRSDGACAETTLRRRIGSMIQYSVKFFSLKRPFFKKFFQKDILNLTFTEFCNIIQVKRVKNTVPMKRLNPAERQNNLKKAFFISSDVVKLKKVIVVDDVYTTGSTIDAVAEELRHHGVEQVYFITLCIGEGV